MLVIRLQRTGRKGHAQFRIVVQDSRRTPTSGKIVAQLGTYNPHSKEVKLDTEKAQTYLSNGAQPSERVVFILSKEGVNMPAWVKLPAKQTGKIRHAEKLRRNQPKEEAPAAEEAAAADEGSTAEPVESVEPAPEEGAKTPAE